MPNFKIRLLEGITRKVSCLWKFSSGPYLAWTDGPSIMSLYTYHAVYTTQLNCGYLFLTDINCFHWIIFDRLDCTFGWSFTVCRSTYKRARRPIIGYIRRVTCNRCIYSKCMSSTVSESTGMWHYCVHTACHRKTQCFLTHKRVPPVVLRSLPNAIRILLRGILFEQYAWRNIARNIYCPVTTYIIPG